MNTLGPQGEPIETRELVRAQAPFDSLTVKVTRDWTADEIMAMSEGHYRQLLWALGGFRLKAILLAAGKSRETPPYPDRKKE
jgi:hypothetical protein